MARLPGKNGLSLRAARQLAVADFSALFGDYMALAAMPFAAISIGGSGSDIALVLAAQVGGEVVGLPIGGVIGDRCQRQRVLVLVDLLRFGLQGAIAVALLTGTAQLWQLIVTQAVHGIATGFYMPSSSAFVRETVPENAAQGVNGLKAVARAIARSIGPGAGGLAVAVAGPGFAVAADAVSFLPSAVLIAGLTPAFSTTRTRPAGFAGSSPQLAAELRTLKAHMTEGFRVFRERRWLWSITLQFAIVNAAVIAPFYVLGPSLSEKAFGGASAWALMLVALAVGELAGGLIAGAWKPHRPLVAAVVVFTAWTLPLFSLALHLPIYIILLSLSFAGFGSSAFDVLWETLCQDRIPEAQRSRVMSIEQFGSLALVPFGYLLAGWLEQTVGITGSFLVSAWALVIATVIVLSLRCVRSFRTSNDPKHRRSTLPGVASSLVAGDGA